MSDRPALYARAANYLDQLTVLAERPHIDRDLMAVMIGIVGECLESLQDGEPADFSSAPARCRWRDWTISHFRSQSPLAVAAAWELAAMEYDLTGDVERAEHARTVARNQAARAA